MSWWTDFKGDVRGFLGTPMDRRAEDASQYQGIDPSNYQMQGFGQMQGDLGAFAQNRGGGQFMQQQGDLAGLLMRQAQGQDSFAKAQLQQDLSRLQAGQQSMAAGASPSNSAMAARLAMQNQGNLGAQMAGQSQLAQIAERNAAAQAAGNVIGQGRQQDIGAFLGAQGQMGQNAANQLQGSMGYEANRFGRFQQAMGTPTKGQGLLNAFSSVLPFAAQMGGGGGVSQGLTQNGPGSDIARSFLPSDINNKKNIVPVNNVPSAVNVPNVWVNPSLSPEEQKLEMAKLAAGQAKADPNVVVNPSMSPEEQLRERAKVHEQIQGLKGVPSYEYEYKEGKGLPPGRRVGQMAQDIEKVAPGAVVNTEKGKAIDYGALQPAMLAIIQQQQKELDALKAHVSRPNAMQAPPPSDITGIQGQLGAMVPGQLNTYYRGGR